MDNSQEVNNQLQYLLSDIGTRLKDVEERSNSLKERILLISQNVIDSRENVNQKLSELDKTSQKTTEEIRKIKAVLDNLVTEISSFVRKEEIILVERMLKDFQPLEFIRKQDLKEAVEEVLKSTKVKIE